MMIVMNANEISLRKKVTTEFVLGKFSFLKDDS